MILQNKCCAWYSAHSGRRCESLIATGTAAEAPLDERSGQSFLYLSGGYRGQDVLRHILAHSTWRPGLIAVVSDAPQAAPLGASECDGIPVFSVPSVYGPDAWWPMAAHGIKGVLAVGVPPDLLEESFLKAFPLGVYGFHAGLLPDTVGPAALNWALIRGLPETGTTLLRCTPEGDGWLLVSQQPCRIEDRETAGTLCTKLSAAAAELWAQHWPAIARNAVALRPAGKLIRGLSRRPDDGAIRWAEHSAASLDCWIRALARPYPGAFFWFGCRRIWVHGVEHDIRQNVAIDAPTLTSVSARGLTLDFPDGTVRISDLCLDDGAEIPGHLLAALAERVGDRLSSLHTGQRVLVVAAHPDDEVLGVGGTLIRHFKSGDEIRAVIVCSANSIRYREGEHDQPGDTQRASHYLGARSTGLGFADQRLDQGSNLELIQALEEQIREFQPQVIYTHWWGDVNADHARIAEAVDVAARPYSAPGLQSIYAFETPSSTEWTTSARARAFAPNVFVDISGELDRKLDAMRCYESELRPPPHPRSLRSLQQRAAYWGSIANMPAAEALALLRTRR
jgi:LmbE family N-acetylglucosaminyl deacetylase/methionyl-tRNA formyltransferase